MAFQDLYQLSDDEIAELDELLCENFMQDELYCTVIPEERKRKYVLTYFFRHYIKCIQPNCHFLADSPDCNSVMVVYDTSLEDTFLYNLRLLWMNIKLLPLLIGLGSFSSIRRVFSCYDMFTSRWVKQFIHTYAFHLDLLYTKEQMRGKGLGALMLQHVIEEATLRQWDITMETHHVENLSLYKRVGFKEMLMITHEDYTLHQYCLLFRIKEDV